MCANKNDKDVNVRYMCICVSADGGARVAPTSQTMIQPVQERHQLQITH